MEKEDKVMIGRIAVSFILTVAAAFLPGKEREFPRNTGFSICCPIWRPT